MHLAGDKAPRHPITVDTARVLAYATATHAHRAAYKRHGRSFASVPGKGRNALPTLKSGVFEPLLHDEVQHLRTGDVLVIKRRPSAAHTGEGAVVEARWEHAVVSGRSTPGRAQFTSHTRSRHAR